MNTHNAPPVAYPLGRSLFGAWFLVCLWLAGVLVLAFWFALAPRFDWRLGIGLIAVALGTAGMILSWKIKPSGGQLTWDGQGWRWESAGYQAGMAEQHLSVLVDLQHLMLLRIENNAGASMWQWAEKRARPERWLDLRRAVYSPVRPEHPLPGASPGFKSPAEL